MFVVKPRDFHVLKLTHRKDIALLWRVVYVSYIRREMVLVWFTSLQPARFCYLVDRRG